jgi:ClpP class serine protease
MKSWLLDDPIMESIDAAIAAGHIVSAEQIEEIKAEYARNAPRNDGGRAVIPIEGILTNKPNFLAAVFGGGNTIYSDIIKAVQKADADPSINEIVLAVGASPGGTIAGLFPAMDAIRESKTPTKAIVEDMALSACFGVVSQADEVIAMTPVTQFGNVGVVKTFNVDGNTVDVTSTKAPKKRTDVTTEEGLAAARESLDDVHDQFAQAIALGRGTTADDVNKNFGQGASVIAHKALSAGMITGIFSKQQTTETAHDGGEEVSMKTLEEFKAAHPALYAEAVAFGEAQARDLMAAHAVRGRACGNLELALEAIESGSEMNEKIKAQYDAAQSNKNAVNARIEENPPEIGQPTESPKAKEDDDVVAKAWAIIDGETEDPDVMNFDALGEV